uniref:Replication protein A OB domain-containing protein n=1 Tax=Daphnia galeata TaxID=27404 RepID=A0A8J2RUA1_9CRUS|nr:unnamed protein product [Daphnia galeata]
MEEKGKSKVTFLTHSNTCLILNLIDVNGDEIRLNVWGAEKAAKYVDKFEVGKVHLIRKVSVVTSTNEYSRILNGKTLVSTQSTTVSIENAEGNDEFPDLTYKYMSVSNIGDIPDREIIDVIGIFYKKKKKMISLQSYNKEEHSFKILDDKGKKMEVGCSTIEQFLQKKKIEELKTIIGLKGV